MMAESTLKCSTSSFFQELCTAQNQLLNTSPLREQLLVNQEPPLVTTGILTALLRQRITIALILQTRS